jgi:hypothetical protein
MSAQRAKSVETPEAKARREAQTAAQVAFVLVLIVALVAVLTPTLGHLGELWDNPFERTQRTTVTKVTSGTPSTSVTTTTGESKETASSAASAAPEAAKETATTGRSTATTTTGQSTETTTTVAPADESLFVAALGNSGLFLVRLGVALLTAFVGAAAVQRAWLGRFGVKVGPVEIPELPEATAVGLEGLKDTIEKLTVRVKSLEEKAKPAPGTAEAFAFEEEVGAMDVELEASKLRVQGAIDRLRDLGSSSH